MNEKPNPMTEQELERELAAMTESSTGQTELWREALQQTRREDGTRRIPGRRRAVGLSALVTAAIALFIGVGAWLGTEPDAASVPESAIASPEQASRGLDVSRALDGLLPQSAAQEQRRQIDSQLRSFGSSSHARLSADMQSGRSELQYQRAEQSREARVQPGRTALRDAPGKRDDAEAGAAMEMAEGRDSLIVETDSVAEPTPSRPQWRLLERRADIGLRVPDVAATLASIEALADTDAGEFVSESSVQGEAYRAKGAAVLRVAANRFDAVVDELSTTGAVEAIETFTEDLSLRAQELDAQMLTIQRTEKDLDDLYHNYATPNFSDAEKLIRSSAAARSSVDSLMAKRAELVDRAEWSTIRVLLLAEPQPRTPSASATSKPRSKSYLSKLSESIGDGLHETGVGLLVVARSLVIGLPFALLIAGGGWLVYRRFIRR